MKTITVQLTNSQIAAIHHDKKIFSNLINSGKCCEMLDLGLSVIDLHALYVTLENAINEIN